MEEDMQIFGEFNLIGNIILFSFRNLRKIYMELDTLNMKIKLQIVKVRKCRDLVYEK